VDTPAAKLALSLGYSVKVSDGCSGAHMSEEAVTELEKKAEELRSLGAMVEIGRHSDEFIIGTDVVMKRRNLLRLQRKKIFP